MPTSKTPPESSPQVELSQKDSLVANPLDVINKDILSIFLKAIDSAKRIEICQECDKYLKLAKICSECNCFMPMKTRLRKTKCPLEKW